MENLKVPAEYCHGTGGSALYASTPKSGSAKNESTKSCIVVVIMIEEL